MNQCADCDIDDRYADLSIIAADYGDGAFLKILCDICDHRRQYRAELRERLRRKRGDDLRHNITRKKVDPS